MKIIFMRHAAFGEQNEMTDELAKYAELQARSIAFQLHEKGHMPTVIITSSTPRVLRTAQIIAATFQNKFNARVEQLLDLTFADQKLIDPQKACARIAERREDTLVVAHQPHISNILDSFGVPVNRTDIGFAAAFVTKSGRLIETIHPPSEAEFIRSLNTQLPDRARTDRAASATLARARTAIPGHAPG
ncbi:MAG: histidine phosphatase family protein [Alphaproteobacteria bacterium]|nr:histidine phosphatase family protein [Alphaproteobacteria bacterium]